MGEKPGLRLRGQDAHMHNHTHTCTHMRAHAHALVHVYIKQVELQSVSRAFHQLLGAPKEPKVCIFPDLERAWVPLN